MIFQPIISDEINSIIHLNTFPNHIHYEIELIYCLSGCFLATAEDQEHEVLAGDVLLVGSMVTHSVVKAQSDTKVLLIEVGPLFLKEHFSALTATVIDKPLVKKQQDSDFAKELRHLLNEIQENSDSFREYGSLIVMGNLYKICALIIKEYYGKGVSQMKKRTLEEKIALQLIYEKYNEPITLEQAAVITRYSKTGLCRVFKKITGMGFHEYLNHYRVKIAKCFLLNTNENMDAIALHIGFNDAKTFCRVFKKVTGLSPNQYRKVHRNK